MEIILFTMKEDAESVLDWIKEDFSKKVSSAKILKCVPFSDDHTFIANEKSNISSINIDTKIDSKKINIKNVSKEYCNLLSNNNKIIGYTVSYNGKLISWGFGKKGVDVKELSFDEIQDVERLKTKLANDNRELLHNLETRLQEEFQRDRKKLDDDKINFLNESKEIKNHLDAEQNNLTQKQKYMYTELQRTSSSLRSAYRIDVEKALIKYKDTIDKCVKKEKELTSWKNVFLENFYCFIVGLSMLTIIIPMVVYFGKQLKNKNLRNISNAEALDSIQSNDRIRLLRVKYSENYSHVDDEIKFRVSESLARDELEELQASELSEWDKQLKEKSESLETL